MSKHLGRGDIRTSNTQARGTVFNLQVHSAINHCSFAPIPPGAGGGKQQSNTPHDYQKNRAHSRHACIAFIQAPCRAINTAKLRLTKASGITTRRRCHLKTFRLANLLRNGQIGKTELGFRDTQSLPEESRRTGRH